MFLESDQYYMETIEQQRPAVIFFYAVQAGLSQSFEVGAFIDGLGG